MDLGASVSILGHQPYAYWVHISAASGAYSKTFQNGFLEISGSGSGRTFSTEGGKGVSLAEVDGSFRNSEDSLLDGPSASIDGLVRPNSRGTGLSPLGGNVSEAVSRFVDKDMAEVNAAAEDLLLGDM